MKIQMKTSLNRSKNAKKNTNWILQAMNYLIANKRKLINISNSKEMLTTILTIADHSKKKIIPMRAYRLQGRQQT